MGDEKVSEYEQISESDQADVAADEVVKDWPDDVELGAVDPTDRVDVDVDDDEDDDDKTHQETPPDDGDKTSAVVFEDDEEVEEL